jgi:hypothetical protein
VPDQFQLNPVVMVGVHVAQKRRRSVKIVDHHVDLPVVEQIAERRAPANSHRSQSCSLHCRNQLELPVPEVVEQ